MLRNIEALPCRAIRSVSIWLSRMDRIDAILAMENARSAALDSNTPRNSRRRAISVPSGGYRSNVRFGVPRLAVRAIAD